MEDCAIYLECEGLGDCIYAIPVLRHIWRTGHKKFRYHIFTHHPELFKACPYVTSADFIDSKDFIKYKLSDRVLHLFDLDKNFLPHHRTDTRDFISLPLGLGALGFREKQLEYFPNEPDTASAFDIVINTSQTWPTRSWSLENWQRLANVLTSRGYSVAVVGKDVRSTADEMDKISPRLENCINLVNALSLDQTFYTIAKCGLFISCQNGLSVLAGATDARIAVLGMSIDWSHRAIFRKENPHYKAHYIQGTCSTPCGVADNCPKPENRGSFLCVPTYDAVEKSILDILNLGNDSGCEKKPVSKINFSQAGFNAVPTKSRWGMF